MVSSKIVPIEVYIKYVGEAFLEASKTKPLENVCAYSVFDDP
jgi:hypothetical protein